MLGDMVYFKVNYMDGFEIGYHLFDPAARNRGLMTEALPMATCATCSSTTRSTACRS